MCIFIFICANLKLNANFNIIKSVWYKPLHVHEKYLLNIWDGACNEKSDIKNINNDPC